MRSGIAALIHKSNVGNMQTFSDLLDQTEVKYGPIDPSHTKAYFEQSREPKIRKMYYFMTQNPQVFVGSKREGIEKVNSTQYAFIMDSVSLEFMANVYCDFQVINDTMQEFNDFTRYYAIALRRGSKYLNDFNKAIKQLELNGELDQLKNKYWTNQCENDLDVNSSFSIHCKCYQNLVLNLLIMLSIIYYSAFI